MAQGYKILLALFICLYILVITINIYRYGLRFRVLVYSLGEVLLKSATGIVIGTLIILNILMYSRKIIGMVVVVVGVFCWWYQIIDPLISLTAPGVVAMSINPEIIS